MFHRIAYAVTLSSLLLFMLGCGQVHRSVAPETDETPSTDAATLAKLAAADATLDADGDDDDDEQRLPAHAKRITAPTVITTPGDYRLDSDLDVASGDGIVIRASNVRLWLGEHRLRGPGNKMGRALVIDGARYVSIRGGHVRRFGFGVVVVGSSKCSVRGVDIRGGDETADPPNGNPPQVGIMLVNSSKNRISRNHLRGVNLGIFVRGGGSYENVIRKNEVAAGDHGLLGICYNPASGEGPAGPRQDHVTHNILNRFNIGIQTSAQSANNRFRSNTIRYFTKAYEDFNGTNLFERNDSRRVAP